MDTVEARAKPGTKASAVESGTVHGSVHRAMHRAMSESSAGMISHEMHIISHHIFLPPFFVIQRQKKDFCRCCGKSLAFSFGSDYCRDDGGQIRLSALSYSLLRYHDTALKRGCQYPLLIVYILYTITFPMIL